MPGRGPVAGAAADDHGAGLLEQRRPAPAPRRPRRWPGRPAVCGSRAAICSAKWVTRTRCGRPASMPASIAAPTSSTWTWTFHSPSPPTTTRESPSPARVLRSCAIGLVGRVEEVHHLVRRPVVHQVGAGLGHDRVAGSVVPASTGGGRLPVSAVSAASRITTTPRPPASTTPASRSDLQLVGRPRQRLAGRGGAGGEHVPRPDRRLAPRAASRPPPTAARQTESMVPSTGVPTAA